MKLILNEDIKGQGKKGDVINVSDGYASNYLLPKKLARLADANNLNSVNLKKEADKFHLEQEKETAQKLCEEINKTAVTVFIKCGENGKVFGSVTAKEISESLQKQNLNIDKKKIVLKEPIKNAGNYVLDVKIFPEICAKLNLIVEKA